jgi:hypothetical protein
MSTNETNTNTETNAEASASACESNFKAKAVKWTKIGGKILGGTLVVAGATIGIFYGTKYGAKFVAEKFCAGECPMPDNLG